MKETPNKNAIIQRLKEYYGLSTNAELADKLGVAQNTISGWIKRNSIDYDLVFSKCEGVDFNWLVSGATTTHCPHQDKSEVKLDKILASPGEPIVPVSQHLKESEAELNLLDYCHKLFDVKKFYDDSIFFDINDICFTVQEYNLRRLFSDVYAQFKTNRNKELFLKAFYEYYRICLEFYNAIAPYRDMIARISDRLSDFVGEKIFKGILDKCDEADWEEFLKQLNQHTKPDNP